MLSKLGYIMSRAWQAIRSIVNFVNQHLVIIMIYLWIAWITFVAADNRVNIIRIQKNIESQQMLIDELIRKDIRDHLGASL